MANRWGISKEVETFVKKRDLVCVYCCVEFNSDKKSSKTKPSWEHIVNDIRIKEIDNITLCCMSCNASKGAKLITDWFESDYCKQHNINAESVAKVVQEAILSPPQLITDLTTEAKISMSKMDLIKKNLNAEENTFMYILHEKGNFDMIKFKELSSYIHKLNKEISINERQLKSNELWELCLNIANKFSYHFNKNDLFSITGISDSEISSVSNILSYLSNFFAYGKEMNYDNLNIEEW